MHSSGGTEGSGSSQTQQHTHPDFVFWALGVLLTGLRPRGMALRLPARPELALGTSLPPLPHTPSEWPVPSSTSGHSHTGLAGKLWVSLSRPPTVRLPPACLCMVDRLRPDRGWTRVPTVPAPPAAWQVGHARLGCMFVLHWEWPLGFDFRLVSPFGSRHDTCSLFWQHPGVQPEKPVLRGPYTVMGMPIRSTQTGRRSREDGHCLPGLRASHAANQGGDSHTPPPGRWPRGATEGLSAWASPRDNTAKGWRGGLGQMASVASLSWTARASGACGGLDQVEQAGPCPV